MGYLHGCDHARRNLRYQGVNEEASALRGRRDTAWSTSIQSKQRDKYETNEISKNIGSRICLRGGVRDSAGTDHDYHDNERPCNGHDDNSADNHHQCWHNCYIHAGFGLLHVPDNARCGAGTLLLYSGHHRGRSCRAHRQFVDHSTRYAGNHLLHESRRQGTRAQGRVEPTTQGLQARGNNYYDNDKTLKEKSLRLNQKRPREISRALCCTHVAACDR
jgi:hypothetical protein